MSNFWREIQNGLSDCKYWGTLNSLIDVGSLINVGMGNFLEFNKRRL